GGGGFCPGADRARAAGGGDRRGSGPAAPGHPAEAEGLEEADAEASLRVPGEEPGADALRRIPGEGLPDRQRGDRRGVSASGEGPDGAGGHALDAEGSAGDAGRAQYLREWGLGGIPSLSHPPRDPTVVSASPPRRRASVFDGRLSGRPVTP